MTHLNIAAERQYMESLQTTEVLDRRASLNMSDALIVLSLVEQYPFSSASDMALHGIFNAQKLTGLLQSLHGNGYVARLAVGRRVPGANSVPHPAKGVSTPSSKN